MTVHLFLCLRNFNQEDFAVLGFLSIFAHKKKYCDEKQTVYYCLYVIVRADVVGTGQG